MHKCERCGASWDRDGILLERGTGNTSLCGACRDDLIELARAALRTFGENAEPPLAVDPSAVSMQKDVPAYALPPPDAEPYYGFLILEDVTVGGFTLGKIT